MRTYQNCVSYAKIGWLFDLYFYIHLQKINNLGLYWRKTPLGSDIILPIPNCHTCVSEHRAHPKGPSNNRTNENETLKHVPLFLKSKPNSCMGLCEKRLSAILKSHGYPPVIKYGHGKPSFLDYFPIKTPMILTEISQKTPRYTGGHK